MKERKCGLVMPKKCESCSFYGHLESSIYMSCGHISNMKFSKEDFLPRMRQRPEEKNPDNKCKYHVISDDSRNGEATYSVNGRKEDGIKSLFIEVGIEIMVSFTAFPFIILGVLFGIAQKGFTVGSSLGVEMWNLYHKIKGVNDESN